MSIPGPARNARLVTPRLGAKVGPVHVRDEAMIDGSMQRDGYRAFLAFMRCKLAREALRKRASIPCSGRARLITTDPEEESTWQA
jgi:hypothetical protein